MRILDIHGLSDKKIRGIKRRCRSMVEELTLSTDSFPVEAHEGDGFWHLHLPVAESFIDSYKTPVSVRRLCVQTLVNRVQYLRSIKPQSTQKIRVVATITLPCLWDSQLIVFYGDEYYGNFFKRDNEYQTWVLQDSHKKLLEEFNLVVPEGLVVRNYLEKITDGENEFKNQLLFIGELD